MKLHSQWGLGMRTLKTALAIWIALSVCEVLHFENSALAAITAVAAVQPSLKGTMRTTKNQLIATSFGCILSALVAYFFHGTAWAISLIAIIAIILCVRLHLKDSIVLLLVTIILISQTPLDNFETAIIQRISMIVIGLFIGMILNIILIPKHENRLLEHLTKLHKEYEDFFLVCIDDLKRDTSSMEREEVQEKVLHLRESIQEARNILKLSEDSQISYDEPREKDQLYLDRRMINALASNLERLIEIHRSIMLAPKEPQYKELRMFINNYLNLVLANHRKIYTEILEKRLSPAADASIEPFMSREDAMEDKMMALIRDAEDLLPLHYWNMTIEGERIMFKTWNLTRIYHEIRGEKVFHEAVNEYYKLQ